MVLVRQNVSDTTYKDIDLCSLCTTYLGLQSSILTPKMGQPKMDIVLIIAKPYIWNVHPFHSPQSEASGKYTIKCKEYFWSLS